MEGYHGMIDKIRTFFVIATQNPIENYGTFPLPEAQLDRFLMKINMGYPGRGMEEKILGRTEADNPLEKLTAICSAEDIILMQRDSFALVQELVSKVEIPLENVKKVK